MVRIVRVIVHRAVGVTVLVTMLGVRRVFVLMIEVIVPVIVDMRHPVGVGVRVEMRVVRGHRARVYGPSASPYGAEPAGSASVVVGALAALKVGVYTVIVELPALPTYSLPSTSKPMLSGNEMPVEIV